MRFPAAIVALVVVAFTSTGCGNSVAGVGPPASIVATLGTAQTAVVGTAVSTPPGVVIKDSNGNGVPGIAVTFVVTGGGGTVIGGTAVTSGAGTATATSWTLGTVAGPNTVTATATGLSPVTFTATGTAGPPASATIAQADPIILIVGASQQLAVTVADQYGNVVEHPSLSYSSNNNAVATVSPVGVVTGVSGGSTLVTIAGAGAGKQVTVIVASHPAGGSNTTIAGIGGRPFGIRVSNTYVVGVTQQDLNSITLIAANGTGVRTVVPVGQDPGDIVFNRSGSIAFVSGYNDGTVKKVTLSASAVSGSVKLGVNAYRLALAPDEARIFVSSYNASGTVYVVDAGLTQSSLSAASEVQGLALTPTALFVYTGGNGRVSRRSATSLGSTVFNDVGGNVQDIAVSSDGVEIYVANEGGWVDVLDATSLASRQRIATNGLAPFGLAVTPDGTQLYVTSPSTGQLFVVDRVSRAIVRTLNVGGTPRRVAFSPDGLTAFVANEGNWVDVIK